MHIHNSDVSLPCATELKGLGDAKTVSETCGQPAAARLKPNWYERLLQIVGVILGDGDDFLSLVTAATIKPKRLKWLWPNRVPLGKLTLFVGNPDNGKSMVAMDVVARVTTARDWFGTKPEEDPLNLEEYQETINNIKTSRGKTVRRLVYDTFLRFFNGTTNTLDWADAARQIS
jgi:hypothetical protein